LKFVFVSIGVSDAANSACERLRRGCGYSTRIILRAIDGTTLRRMALAEPPPRKSIF
jgi:hypothetical protein